MPIPDPSLVAVRIPAELVSRADALLPVVTNLPDAAGLTRPTRAGVIRVALTRGLASMERDLARAGKAPPAR